MQTRACCKGCLLRSLDEFSLARFLSERAIRRRSNQAKPVVDITEYTHAASATVKVTTQTRLMLQIPAHNSTHSISCRRRQKFFHLCRPGNTLAICDSPIPSLDNHVRPFILGQVKFAGIARDTLRA